MSSPSQPAPTAQKNRAADSHEIRALTGIRGVAAIWVVLVHHLAVFQLMFPATDILDRPISRGPLGVDLFFLLSGFILSYVYASGNLKFGLHEYGHFIWYRIARIFPNHWVTLLFLVVFVSMSHLAHIPMTGSYPYSHLIFQATLTQQWPFVAVSQGREWVNTAWSLSAEWFAYLFVFPLVAYIHRRKWATFPSLLMIFATLSLRLLAANFVLQHAPFGAGLLAGVCDFFAGGLTFSVFFNGGFPTTLCQKLASFVALAIIAIVSFGDFPDPWQGALTVFLMALLLIGLTSNDSWASRFLSTRFIIWLGKISYALYISHTAAQKILKVAVYRGHYELHSFPIRLLIIIVDFSLIFLLAALLHYLVEIPARNYMRKIRPWSQVQNVSRRFISRGKTE
jgi:peptidoglycan/LPS O-acetylase OafA/YrhL